MTERPEGKAGPEAGLGADAAGSGVTDEVTPDPGAAHAQEVPPSESLGGETGGEDVDTDSNDTGTDDTGSNDTGTDDTGTDINTEAVNDSPPADASTSPTSDHPDTVLARERLADLQRLQAEYVNYKRRVDRDRALVQERVIADVLDSLLPVLDDIHAAREHGDLTDGPFAAIADKLETSLGKFGLERYGSAGETFDPTVHEALLHAEWDGSITPADPSATTVVQVLQPGYRTGQRVIRPARVSVADPS